MKIVTLAVLFFATSLMAMPVAESFNEDLEITQFVEEIKTPSAITDELELKLVKPTMSRGDMDIDAATVIFDKVVNLGKKMWALVENNKPVVNVKYLYANALPQGVRSASELDGFSPLQATSYRVYGQNLYGMTVYDLTYSLVHRYGGNYQGRGNYLESVAVVPTALDVLWGYTVEYNVDKVSTVNTGTRENPVGSILLETNFKVSTVIKSSESHSVYDFRGDSAKVTAVQR